MNRPWKLIYATIVVTVGVALCAGTPGLALASHGFGGFGGGGGGGFNWGGLAGSIIGGMSRSSGGHHSGGYRPQPRSYSPPQSNRHVNVYTPNQSNYPQPSGNYIPQQPAYVPQSRTIPQANVIPRVKPNPVMPKLVAIQPVSNTGLKQRIKELSPQDIAKMSRQLRGRNDGLLNKITQQLLASIDQLINALPGAAQLSPEDRQRLVDAIGRGDVELIRRLLDPANLNTPAGQQLIGRATIQQLIDAARAGMNNAGLTGADLVNLIDAVRGTLTGDVQVNININIGQIAVNQQIIIWLGNAQPGFNPIPAGPDVPIALIPGFPQGLIIPLGFGPVLIGIGQPGDTIYLGEGDVTEVAGMLVPIGPPIADYQGTFTPSDIILANAGADAINYLVNQQPYSMQPMFKQPLPTGAWVVEFDRGGGKGTASYTITNGYYEFTPTPGGWDLYKKTFKTQLENGNDFDFHYVIDNQRRMLAPHQVQDLSGAFPPVIQFENGVGAFKQKKLASATYRVAIAADDSLEIYPENSVPAEPAQPVPTAMLVAGPLAGPATAGAPVAATAVAATGQVSLPPGFRLFNPVAALTSSANRVATAGNRLPAEFNLFAAAEVAQQATSRSE